MIPRLAVCHHAAPDTQAAIALAREGDLPSGIEITVDPTNISGSIEIAQLIGTHSAGEVGVRFHFPLGVHEISAESCDQAEATMSIVRDLIAAIGSLGGGYLTVHAALPATSTGGSRFDATCNRLSELVVAGKDDDVVVCLENLRWGATSDPETFLRIADHADCKVTFDVGHAVSSDAASAGWPAERFAATLADRIVAAHVYGYETSAHHAPDDLDSIGPALDVLLQTACEWWTIELVDVGDVRRTRAMLTEFLQVR
jgi:sugar phosphate isomerase/epimerase